MQLSCPLATFPRFLNNILLAFLFQGPLIKAEYWEKGYPHYKGAPQEPSFLCLPHRNMQNSSQTAMEPCLVGESRILDPYENAGHQVALWETF